MVIDTLAALAILLDESEADDIAVAIDADPVRPMSAASHLETTIPAEAQPGDAGGRELGPIVHKAAIRVVAVTPEQAEAARAAWRRFGKGRHGAGLTVGDCFSYALAVTAGEALLYTGKDSTRTDVERVVLGIE